MYVESYSDVRANLEAVIDRTINDAEITLIHRKQGGNAVLMSEDYFNSLQETFYLNSTTANKKALEQAIAQHKAGKALKRNLLEIDDE